MLRVHETNINPVPWTTAELQQTYNRLDRFILMISLVPHINRGESILAVGVGGGREVRVIREFGLMNAVDVADYSTDALEFLKQKNIGIDNFYQCDLRAESLDLPVRDIVLCTEVIEHMDDPIALIQKLKRHARKRVIVTCPNEDAMSELQHVNHIEKKDLQFDGAYVAEIMVFQPYDHLLAVYPV